MTQNNEQLGGVTDGGPAGLEQVSCCLPCRWWYVVPGVAWLVAAVKLDAGAVAFAARVERLEWLQPPGGVCLFHRRLPLSTLSVVGQAACTGSAGSMYGTTDLHSPTAGARN